MRRNRAIEFSALRIFATVADSETLTHAAQRLGITQSAVSQTIKHLEELTEVVLLVRRSRPIKLTPSGEVLQEYAQRALSETNRILNDVKLASSGSLSNLNVGMIDSFSDSLGLQFISEIKPLVSKVTLQTGLHVSLSEALGNRDIDILYTSDRMHQHPHLTNRALIRDPFVAILPQAEVPEAGNARPDVAALSRVLPFIHYLPSTRIGAQTALVARRLGIELNTQYELDSTQTLMRFVQAGYGWALISAMCLVRYPRLLEGVAVVNLDDGANARVISQVTRKNELGDMPETFATVARDLFRTEISPKLARIADWLPEQAYAIDKMPSI
ncbi:MAG: LysR family transcriptional regulator [Gammaproteobacteria bacterium]|nr:LysR family transcriptional regulator [Gammaproteobacteria bacterium]